MSGHRTWRDLKAERLAAMTPEQRAETEAARERAREELDAERAEYLAMFEGAPAGSLFPEGIGAVLGEILTPKPPAEQDGLPWVHHFPAPAICGHCGGPITQASRGIAADGTLLCHTGTIPPGNDPQDCYRLVTQYSHASDGSCCRDRVAPPWKSFKETPDDFAGCSRSGCRRTGVHSLKFGECEFGVRPSPEFGFWRTFIAEDGYPSIGMASIPLLAVLPWAAALTVDEQYQMLEEATDHDQPAEVIGHWRRYVESKVTCERAGEDLSASMGALADKMSEWTTRQTGENEAASGSE